MAHNTAQSEAMQAVRLLRGHALASGSIKTTATIEAIYQACRLLEGFIEDDLRAKIDTALSDDEDMTCGITHSAEHVYNGAVFRVGEYLLSDYGPRLEKGKIQSISVSPHEMITYNVGGWNFCIKLSDIFHLNRKGSFK
jgi:hypothetical protein